MFFNERKEKIIDILKEKNHASVHYLANKLFVSEPTIRRDLVLLEKDNRIIRTFGGAVLNDMRLAEIPFEMRASENLKAKETIALKAKEYIKNGQVIFLDASSTVFRLIPHLVNFSNLTVITNGPKASLALTEYNIKNFCTGGIMLNNSKAYVGTHAENAAANFNADVFFFSCRGISENGILTDSSMEECDLRRVMMKHSQKNIFLCTSNKIGKQYMYNLCEASDVDIIIYEK